MLKTVTIRVTLEDIGCGQQEVCDKCPIALAGIRAVPDATGVSVGSRFISFRFPAYPDGLICRLPAAAERFIRDFDYGEPVGSFSFPVTINSSLPNGED